jgi:hypothetical protein
MNAAQVQQALEQGIYPETIRSFGVVPEAFIQQGLDAIQKKQAAATAPVWKTPAHREVDPFDADYDTLVSPATSTDPYPKFPEALKQSKGFVTWKGDVQDKQPYQSGTTIPASYNNPDHLAGC